MKQLAAWYQKKISSYDKEEWETMVEQLLMRGTYRRRVVDFSEHARPYLIDVDLVRGKKWLTLRDQTSSSSTNMVVAALVGLWVATSPF
ncbi:hypothetical protein JYU34_012596 [Plutella xylostella]|uniref:PHTF1/2 N-terminal domain-containing protein n=1 Tax=Plutella xylostella TaxID=51655 RepID=A0ABQ7QC61_PLUXY|nr:hypothetical protein JYU34_012596 [Plutella xylostella]